MQWLEQTFAYAFVLSEWQQFGIAFLLGSFTVATLSDIKHLAAQREFLEVWLLFLLAVLVFEAYDVHAGKRAGEAMALKWGLIALLSLLSLRRVGVLFRLAPGDVAALAAAASLLAPTPILVLYGLAKVLDWVAQRLIVPGRPVYPFMPVVSLATLGVLASSFLL